ncbi:MAG: sigma-70 family RNA polymerase sigma factor [Winogradskyella sp.]|uniref:RNA polymerase sigma factor n=1 Tax=Winogradskyella sp. TaxID=1883156 RepID=UPI0017EFAD06|nr:sigma-70 family RNA polymerase sigma factor [Winogradskyella sp.]MBT8246036.1 sigma-70 family RNA polymerase sigma factor [Winogradskyella sp.]NNK22245.1 sigma-70 family RNA polymerase sigma factor [Winogradskyella sp.]
MSLEKLIKQCKNKNINAQSKLYKLYASKLFSLCLKYSKSYAEAEDNLQDAFVTVFNKIDQYKNKGSFDGWIKRITINTALQRYRQVSVYSITDETAIEDTSVQLEEDVDLDFLLKIIQDLPHQYRLVFNLYVLDGFSHNEVSEMLKISSGTSKSNLSRARLILKEKIEDYKANLSS